MLCSRFPLSLASFGCGSHTAVGHVRAVTGDPNHIRGYGLEVGVNDRKSQLLLDTGASGIVINRPLAEKSGVTRLSDTRLGGMGDRGGEKGYIGLAKTVKTLKIGELEFRDCEVRVLDRRSVVGEDGLIGSDVFSSFLVDLDFPVERVRLTQLRSVLTTPLRRLPCRPKATILS